MNRNDQKGITLISLVVSIIVMLILTSVTVTTSFTAYENAKAEKMKAQLKAVEEAVSEFREGWFQEAEEGRQKMKTRIREKEQIESKLNLLKEKNASGTYTYSSAETDLMDQLEDQLANEYQDVESDSYVFTIDDTDDIVRTLKAGGTDNHNWSEVFFEDQIQKYGYPEEKINYIGISGVKNHPEYFSGEMLNWNWDEWWSFFDEYYPEVRDEFKYYVSMLGGGRPFEVIAQESGEDFFQLGMINTMHFYNFNSEEIEKVFGLKDIDISVNIDASYGVVLLSKPEKIDGKNIYTIRQLDKNASIGAYSTRSAAISGKIRIDEIANYGTSKKIKLTLNNEEAEFDNETYNLTDYKIRKAYYKTKKDNDWYEVDDLKECEYSEDGKSVSFIVYESGDYKFRLEDTSGRMVLRAEIFNKFNIRNSSTEDSSNYELLGASGEDYYNIILCNAPQLTSDMIPIKWIYEDDSKRSGFWVVCTTIDPEWYNYSEDTKMWANVMFKKDSGKGSAGTFAVGEQIAESMLGSTFVWVPRFASRIDTTKGTKLGYNVQFVRDTSNTTTFGTNAYATNLEIPIAFKNKSGKQGSWDAELKGLWFAKYDTGLEVENITYGYGGSYTVNNIMWDNNGKYDDTLHYFDKFYKEGQNFHAVSKPYHVAWGNINFSTAFTQSLMFYRNVATLSEDKSANINSHMMKTTEYDILQAITREPKTGATSLKANTSNRYTGGSDGKNGFSVMNFTAQSSTGNITGIFDVAGTTEVMLSEWNLSYGLTTQYVDLLNSAGQFIVYHKYSIGDITSWAGSNGIESREDLINVCTNYNNKYFQLSYDDSGTQADFIIGEDSAFSKKQEYAGFLATDYTKNVDNPNKGFRIIIANSPSATTENFIFTNENYIPNEDSNGFFVTDEAGNAIKTNDEYLDADGNQTFYPMSQLLNEDYLRIEDFVMKPGSKFYLLKQKTGKLNIALGGSYIAGDPYTDAGAYNLHEFEDGLFKDWNETSSGGKLLKVNLGKSTRISKIGSRVFENCTSLQEIILPENLEEIGYRTFANCHSLNNVQLPESLKKIGGTDYTIGPMVGGNYVYTSLEGESFMNCISLNSIIIPKQVQVIGCKSFYGCEMLSSVVIEESAENKPFIISAHAFAETAITSMKFTYKLHAQLQKGAFANCHDLESVVVYTYGLDSMDYAAFAGCDKLESFLQVDSYNYGDGCIYLLEDTYNPAYTSPAAEANLKGAFQNCTALKNIDISLFGGIYNTIIPDNTFYGCSNLGVENVKNISEYITNIKTRAFLNCPNIGSETAPFTIPINAELGRYAFGTDSSLNGDIYMYYAGTLEDWHNLSKDSKWLSNATAIITTSDSNFVIATSSGVGADVVEDE